MPSKTDWLKPRHSQHKVYVVSGSPELARRTGAGIYHGKAPVADFGGDALFSEDAGRTELDRIIAEYKCSRLNI